MKRNEIQKTIEDGKTVLGIEFGSTRIKAVLIGEDHAPIASGAMSGKTSTNTASGHTASKIVWTGLQESYRNLATKFSRNTTSHSQTIGCDWLQRHDAWLHGIRQGRKSAGPISHLAKHHYRTGIRGTHGSVPVQHSPTLEHCPPLSGDIEQGTPCQGYQPI